MTDKKKKWLWFCLVVLPLICSRSADAISKKNVIRILVKQNKLFHNNSVASTVFRSIGWGITKGLTVLADAVSGLYETCFGFIDFTKYSKVTEFMNAWKNVFIALMCLSLLFIGIWMVIGWEKKPQIVINLLIAVTVVTCGTSMIKTLNSWLSDDLRAGIIGSAGDVNGIYSTVGSNIHDLIYLDKKVGLENLNKKDNAKMVYEKFTQKQFNNLDINEVVEPDDVGDGAKDIVSNQLVSLVDKNSKTTYDYTEIYDGVAWTDLLNEYYYRYTVDWGVLWLELLSMIIVYLFMSYKVIRIGYEIAIQRIMAYLYASNLNNNQKILKILDSIKDSYILLVFTMILIKVYLLALKYVNHWDVGGLTKGIILIFIAFVVIDGPNIIQRITGTDIGASNEMSKMISTFYGGRMAVSAVGSAARTAGKAGSMGKRGLQGMFQSNKNSSQMNNSQIFSSETEEKLAQQMDNTSEGNRDGTSQKAVQANGDKNSMNNMSGNDSLSRESNVMETSTVESDTSVLKNESGHNAIDFNGSMAEGAAFSSSKNAQGNQEIGVVQSRSDALNGKVGGSSGVVRQDEKLRKMDADISRRDRKGRIEQKTGGANVIRNNSGQIISKASTHAADISDSKDKNMREAFAQYKGGRK